MNTTVRRRISRIICATCISTGLLVSAGAATALAASQPANASVQPAPRDDNGGGSDSGGSNSGGSNSGGSDNGGGHDNSGGWSNNGGGHDNSGSWSNNEGGHDNSGSWSNNEGGSNNSGRTWSKPSGNNNTNRSPNPSTNDRSACEKAGGIWSDGYCGKFNKIQGTNENNSSSDVKASQVGNAAAECGKFAVGPVLGTVGKVIKYTSQTSAIVEDLKTGHQDRVIWKLVPGAECTRAVIVAISPIGSDIAKQAGG
ncbi:hypothetical protein [Streptomyces sp. 900105755]